MNKERIDEIIKDHFEWLKSNGKKGKRADLYGANLRAANLYGTDLYGADLSRAIYDEYTIWPEGFDMNILRETTNDQ